ncbi:MAG: type II secretion system F family protein [Actinomycetota bacterium]
MAAVAFGAGLGVAGLLAAAAIRAGARDRSLAAIGAFPGASPSPRTGRLAARAAGRGWPFGAASYVGALVGASVLAGLAGFRLAGPVGAVAGLVGAPLGLEAVLSRRLARRRERAEDDLKEVVVGLAAGARAGLSLRRALSEAVAEAEPPLRAALEGAVRRLGVGEPMEEALASLARDIGSPDADLLVTVLGVYRRTGGDLPALLDQVAEIVGHRAGARRQIRSLTAQGRASGTVLAVLPIAFVSLLSGTGGDGLGAFYRTWQGSALLLAGLVCEALGFAWIRRIVRPRP